MVPSLPHDAKRFPSIEYETERIPPMCAYLAKWILGVSISSSADLSENAEYDAAKEAQGHLEDRINKLEAINGNARVVDTSKLDVSVVRLLTKVTIKNTANSMEMTYSIVPEAEANLRSKKISVSSPIGKGLLGKSIGEIAEIQIPNGIIKFEVVKIEAA